MIVVVMVVVVGVALMVAAAVKARVAAAASAAAGLVEEVTEADADCAENGIPVDKIKRMEERMRKCA